jgi:GNAT superfamily N-acetyltransferase
MQYTIKELKAEAEMIAQFNLIKQLNVGLKLADYKRMLKDMLKHNYRMIGVYDKTKCIGISGFWIATKIYSDKYVELDNVVIDEKHRSKGIGKLLCDWILNEAKKQGCKTAMLDAYVENSSGHSFYFREGFIARGFHFIKKL